MVLLLCCVGAMALVIVLRWCHGVSYCAVSVTLLAGNLANGRRE